MKQKLSGTQRLRENVRCVQLGVHMNHLDDLQLNLFDHEVDTNSIMLDSLEVPAKILRKNNHGSIISKHNSGSRLRESQLLQLETKPQDILGRFHCGCVLSFGRRHRDVGLLRRPREEHGFDSSQREAVTRVRLRVGVGVVRSIYITE